MLGKKAKAIILQKARIAELEEILCPYGQHDFIDAGYHFQNGSGMGDELMIYHYICRRCKKKIQSQKRIN